MNHKIRKFDKLIFPFLRIIFAFFCWLKYKYVFPKGQKPLVLNEPTIIVSNHRTDFDPALISTAISNHFYLVASEHVYRLPMLGFLVKNLLNPIFLFKGTSKVLGVRQMLSLLREGNNVCFFPEGERSFDGTSGNVGEATIKLIQRSGAGLVTYRIEGGYFVSPRWGRGLRTGPAFGYVMHHLTSQQVKAMSFEQLKDIVLSDIYVDDNALCAPKPQNFAVEPTVKSMAQLATEPAAPLKIGAPTKIPLLIYDNGGFGAEYIENYIFICPKCKGFHSLKSRGNEVSCSLCGFKAYYGKDGFFYTDSSFDQATKESVYEWGKLQEKTFNDYIMGIRNNAKSNASSLDLDRQETHEISHDPIFSDENIRLFSVDTSHNETQITSGTLCSYIDKLTIGDMTFSFKNLEGMDQVGKGNNLLFHHDGIHFELWGDMFCGYKYVALYKAARQD